MPKYQSLHWRPHVALDLGTATARIATGASSFMEKPSRIGAKRALHNGVIIDTETALEVLKPLLGRAKIFGMVKPCVLACAPSDADEEERSALSTAVMGAGASSVSIIPEPLAAAIGSGLDVSSQYAQMIIDIGEGVTDCAVVKSGKIQTTWAVRQGGAHMRSSIVNLSQLKGWTTCDEAQAESLLRTWGLKRSSPHDGGMLAATAVQPVVDKIADEIEGFMKDLPDRLACDVIDSGVCLTGGGALIPGIQEYLEQRLRVTVSLARHPLTSVAEGARAVLLVILSLNQWQ